MKKIKSFIIATLTIAMAAPIMTSCKDDDDKNEEKKEIINNIVSEYDLNDKAVAAQKAKSGKDVAVLLVAFGSTWNNAFQAFDATKAAYEKEFPNADVYVSFSSDICINRASVGENTDEKGEIVKRDYYEPRYLLHAIGKAKYSKIYVQSLQVIPGEEFANVVACVKKFMNNGYIASAHLDDEYLAKLAEDESIFLGMPLLSDADEDVTAVAEALHAKCASEVAQGAVAFMGHGNPDSYDTFKANVRYEQLQAALRKVSGSENYYVGTVDAPGMYKDNVYEDMSAKHPAGKVFLHTLMSIAGDHAHNDMAGEGEDYQPAEGTTWDDNEEVSWNEYFKHFSYDVTVPLGANNEPEGLLEIPSVLRVWIEHTKNAEFLEDAYHSMYPEE